MPESLWGPHPEWVSGWGRHSFRLWLSPERCPNSGLALPGCPGDALPRSRVLCRIRWRIGWSRVNPWSRHSLSPILSTGFFFGLTCENQRSSLNKCRRTWTNSLRINVGYATLGSDRFLPALPVSQTGCPSPFRWSGRLAVGPLPVEFFFCVFWSWLLWVVSLLLLGNCCSS